MITVGYVQVADLSILKTDNSDTYTPGGTVTYTITVGNAGPSNVTGATVTDDLPATLSGTMSCGSSPGAQPRCSNRARIIRDACNNFIITSSGNVYCLHMVLIYCAANKNTNFIPMTWPFFSCRIGKSIL